MEPFDADVVFSWQPFRPATVGTTDAPGPEGSSGLLLENGTDFLLLENGDYLLLEQ